MNSFIVEWTLEEAVSDERLAQLRQMAEPCLDQYGVHWVRSYLSQSRRRMVCCYEADDAESVRMALRTAGLTFESVWPAEELTPEAMRQ